MSEGESTLPQFSILSTGCQFNAALILRFFYWFFKCLNGKAPAYLRDMLQFKDTRYTRSVVDDKLAVPRTKCSTFGDRAFSVYGPVKWNRLPREIRYCADLDDFKTKLKTHLFIEYYSSH